MTWKLPGYVVEDLLGYGGSGEVWRGHASSTGAPVALKRLPVSDAAQAQAARAEAALLSTLDHPHLIGLHELVPAGDAVVLVLDLADGGSLADLLARRGRLTPGETITALAPIGAALAYAHDEGVVHGDVTPANVLFTAAGLPLLADLGVARIIGDASPAHSTPAYVDPSVASGCAPGAPSDVFMLAAVALHALTGTPVWTGETAEEMLARACAGELDDLPARLAGLPPDLATVLERALSVEPHLRCTAAEFALDLRHSAEPAPVELSAGRDGYAELAPTAMAEQFRTPPSGTSPSSTLAPTASEREGADPARPTFSRPGDDTPMSNPAQLTHGVRAALHAPVAAHRSRLRRASRLTALMASRRAWQAGLAVLVLAGVAAGAVLWSGSGGRAARPHSPPPASPTQPPVTTEALAADVLHRLDQLREQAFARRQAALLTRVYLPGPLLQQDTALLERVVPRGCGLVGVRTTYSDLDVRQSAGHLVLATTATLAASTLTCSATPSGGASGEAPTRLRIELVRQPDGYRIAGQQKLG